MSFYQSTPLDNPAFHPRSAIFAGDKDDLKDVLKFATNMLGYSPQINLFNGLVKFDIMAEVDKLSIEKIEMIWTEICSKEAVKRRIAK